MNRAFHSGSIAHERAAGHGADQNHDSRSCQADSRLTARLTAHSSAHGSQLGSLTSNHPQEPEAHGSRSHARLLLTPPLYSSISVGRAVPCPCPCPRRGVSEPSQRTHRLSGCPSVPVRKTNGRSRPRPIDSGPGSQLGVTRRGRCARLSGLAVFYWRVEVGPWVAKAVRWLV